MREEALKKIAEDKIKYELAEKMRQQQLMEVISHPCLPCRPSLVLLTLSRSAGLNSS